VDDDAAQEAGAGDVHTDWFDASVLSITENDELVSWLLGGGAVHDSPVPDSPSRAPAVEARACTTSIKVFKRHLFPAERGGEGAAQASVDSVISRECYEDWLSTRSRAPAEPEKTFQRTLTCTVSGTDGRQPFTPEEEAAVLKQLRVKRVWPAFAETGLAIGIKGFRGCVPWPALPRARTDANGAPRQPRLPRKGAAARRGGRL